MAFIEEVIECIPNRQRLEVLLEDGTPTDIARVPCITMINEVRVNPLDLVDGLNDRHWRVEVFALHCIVAPCDDPSTILWKCLGIRYTNMTFE
jgi:hypothetical protein